MKKYILPLLFSFFIFNSYGSTNSAPSRINALLRFIANYSTLRDGTLYHLISKRCNRYMPHGEVSACRVALKRQIEVLDYDLVFNDQITVPSKDAWSPDAFVFIAFKQTLINTLSDPRTTVYLDEVKQGLNDFLTGADPKFNIWDKTLAFYKSPLTAARVIAALFQDTSTVKLHLAYLEKTKVRGRMAFDTNRDRLDKIIDTINMILDYSENNYRALFYPAPLREHLNRNIYHFYVPLYLSMALAAEGFPTKYALSAPLMMTLTYEFITVADDYRYLVRDPERLDPVKHAETLKDIFAGHSGASFGLGKIVVPGMYVLMNESFARSTEDGVKLLLHSVN